MDFRYKFYLTFVCVLDILVLCIAQPQKTTSPKTTETAKRKSTSYVIMASASIRPGQSYNLAINILDIGTSFDLAASIIINDGGPLNKIAEAAGTYSTHNNGLLSLQVPQSLPSGSYSILIDSIPIKTSSPLIYTSKSASIFVQLDKAIYKPSDKIQFRIILVNAFLIPINEKVDFYIQDPNGNKIKEWKNVDLYKGLFSEFLQLSDRAVLGDWFIAVSYRLQSYNKAFTVAEYVLPKYEVKLDIPSYGLIDNGKIKIVGSLSAKYTFGGPVKGSAVITIRDPYGIYLPNNSYVYELASLSTVVIGVINFQLEADINKYSTIDTANFNGMQYEVNAIFIDDLTNKNNSVIQIIPVYSYPNKLVLTAPQYYKPGIPYNLIIRALQVDDKPIANPKVLEINVKVTYSLTAPIIIPGKDPIYSGSAEIDAVIPKSGILKVVIFVGEQNISNINIQAKYLDNIQVYYLSSSRFEEPSMVFIEIEKGYSLYKINDNAKINVYSNKPQNEIFYLVTSRGVIIDSNSIIGGPSVLSFVINLNILASMAPRCVLLVYAVYDDIIIADSLNIQVDGYSQNFVSMKWDSLKKKPGDKSDISIKTSPNSLVAILTVDKSVQLLSKANEINQDSIIDELSSYSIPVPVRGGGGGMGGPGGPRPPRSADRNIFKSVDSVKRRCKRLSRPFIPWFFGGTSADIIRAAGIIVFSDATIYERPIYYYPTALTTRASQDATGPEPPAGPQPEGIKIRSNFPETWIWFEAESDKFGYLNYSRVVPDTITSWASSVISLNDISGLVIGQSLPELLVSLPFFVLLNLPYSVIRGESVSIQVIVFNYSPKNLTASVSLAKSIDYDIVGKAVKSVKVPKDNGVNVFYTVRFKNIGNIKLNVKATSPSYGDGVDQFLIVKAEGQQLFFNKPFLISIPVNKYNVSEQLDIDWPKNMVPGSNRLDASVIGDILGPSLSNLGNLIRMPYGCGEQNMLNFAPNVYIYKYLKSRNLLDSDLLVKLKDYTEQGYQRELTYQRSDGSFSAFGISDLVGSIWLTAFVIKSFVLASDGLIFVDPVLVKKAMVFILNNQQADGSFKEIGNVIHKEMQGGSAGSIPLSAYVFEALLEARTILNGSGEYSSNYDLAFAYLAELVNSSAIATNPYQLSIVCYALNAYDKNSTAAQIGLIQLRALSKIDNGLVFWSEVAAVPTCPPNTYCYAPISLDFEMTSYALLSFSLNNLVPEGIPVMRWLINNRNSIGGFTSSQDTCVGLLALSKFLSLFNPTIGYIQIRVEGISSELHIFNVSNSNLLIVQSALFQNPESHLSIVGLGSGSALVQISWSYNVPNALANKGFSMDVTVSPPDVNKIVEILVCIIYLGSGDSNMVILELTTPSGYVVDDSSIDKSIGDVKKVDVSKGGTKLDIYYNSLNQVQICPSIKIEKQFDVSDLKASEIKISDYYKPEIFAIGKIVIPPP